VRGALQLDGRRDRVGAPANAAAKASPAVEKT
jgi:hypothetical protein